jgi:hypothetical protein
MVTGGQVNPSGLLLVVLGMHRSGTSALTGVLTLLGFQAGKSLLPASAFNERGYFEDSLLVHQHELLLRALGYSWQDERPFPIGWHMGREAAEAKMALKGRLRAEYDLEQPCVIKDPRMCRLLPLWKDMFAELGIVPGYLLSLRDPLEVAESLMRRDGLPANRVALLYAAYLLEAERETRGLPRVVVEYGSLLENWRKVLWSIECGLGISLPTLDEARASSVQTFLSADLKHCSAARALPGEWSEEGGRGKPAFSAYGDQHDRDHLDSFSSGRVDGPEHFVTGNPMRIAKGVYRLMTGTMDSRTLQALDALQAELDLCLSSLEPWLSNAAQVEQLKQEFKQELLQPRERTDRAAESGAKSVLYWRPIDGEYSEAHTVQRPWHFGLGPETLRFVLPPRVVRIGSLRWDITDRPAFCEVSDAWIENAEGVRVWQWQLGMPLFGQMSEDMKVVSPTDGRNQLWVVSLGFDPYAPLSVPQDILAKMAEGWVFGVVLSASLTAKGLPHVLELLEERSRVHQETPTTLRTDDREKLTSAPQDVPRVGFSAELEEMAAPLRQRIASRDQTIAALSNSLQQLEEKQNELYGELLRTEAQLDFLKDVLLKDMQLDRL